MRPEVGGITPVITLISVDFPAPLSPIRPTISFRPMARLMSLSAWIGPKNFWTPSSRTTVSWASSTLGRAAAVSDIPRLLPSDQKRAVDRPSDYASGSLFNGLRRVSLLGNQRFHHTKASGGVKLRQRKSREGGEFTGGAVGRPPDCTRRRVAMASVGEAAVDIGCGFRNVALRQDDGRRMNGETDGTGSAVGADVPR